MWEEDYEEDMDPLSDDKEENTDEEDFGDSDFEVGGEEEFIEDED